MGSILNFVFLSNKLEKNGGDGFITGPFFSYILERNQYSYTLNGELKPNCKNVLMMEGSNMLESFLELNTEIIQFIKNNDVKLLAISLADPTIYEKYLKVLEFLNKTLGPNKFEIIDSNVNLPNCHSFDYFLEESTWDRKQMFDNEENDLGYISEEIDESELNNVREKKFLSFNRNVDKQHRAVLFHEWIHNDFSDSYFSFIKPIEYVNEILNVGIIEDLDFYNSKLPIELDTTNCDNRDYFKTSNTFKKELFLNSYVNIVTETSCYSNELFISEKIIKPILNYQPFIVLGPVGYLKRLKSYGFKTFDKWWDESYDDIEDPSMRLKYIIDTIRELNELSIDEFHIIYSKLKNICIYNRTVFDSLELDSFPQIFKKIENEW